MVKVPLSNFLSSQLVLNLPDVYPIILLYQEEFRIVEILPDPTSAERE